MMNHRIGFESIDWWRTNHTAWMLQGFYVAFCYFYTITSSRQLFMCVATATALQVSAFKNDNL